MPEKLLYPLVDSSERGARRCSFAVQEEVFLLTQSPFDSRPFAC